MIATSSWSRLPWQIGFKLASRCGRRAVQDRVSGGARERRVHTRHRGLGPGRRTGLGFVRRERRSRSGSRILRVPAEVRTLGNQAPADRDASAGDLEKCSKEDAEQLLARGHVNQQPAVVLHRCEARRGDRQVDQRIVIADDGAAGLRAGALGIEHLRVRDRCAHRNAAGDQAPDHRTATDAPVEKGADEFLA